ncbi:MAG TPA: fibronectin type III domain-containing protein [Chloroflexota bacterium]
MNHTLSQYRINIYQNGLLLQTVDFSAPATEKVIAPLANYHTYTFTVQVKQTTVGANPQASAWSLASAVSNAIVPPGGSLPGGVPTLAAYGGNAAALITWGTPASVSGLRTYQVTAYKLGTGGWTVDQRVRTAATSPTAVWVTNLVNGQSYRFTAQAANAAGWGPESVLTVPVISPSSSLIASPTLTSISAGSGSVTVWWTEPNVSGINHYVVLLTRDDGTLVTYRDYASSPLTFTGLTNGVAYTVQIRAVTTLSMLSLAAQYRIIPPTASAPAAVTSVQAVAGIGMASVSWLPAYDGGSPITSYIVAFSANPNDVAAIVHPSTDGSMFNGARWTVPIYSLTNGKTYTFWVYATNAVGTSQGAMSNSVVPQIPARAPDAATGVTAVAGIGKATVSWLPAYDGGSTITSYIVTFSANPNDVAAVIHPATDGAMFIGGRWNVTVNGLANGKSYTFYVYAINAVGASQPSAPAGVTMATVPGAVRNLAVTPGDGTLTIKWDQPSIDGGYPIQSYQVMASDGVHPAVVATVLGTSATLVGLTNGFTYTVTVTAANALGIGSPASAYGVPRNLAPSITVPLAMTVDFGDVVNGTVTATGPETTDHLVLSASGLPAGVTFIDKGNGTGIVSGNANVPAGTYTMTFVANDGHNPSVSQTTTLTVVREQAAVRLFPTAPLSVQVKSAQLTARSVTIRSTIRELTDPNGNADIGEASDVTYTLTSLSNGSTYSGKALTAGHGIEATMVAQYTFHNVPRGMYELRISIGGSYYTGAAVAMVAVSSPSVHGRVSGNGMVQAVKTNAAAQFQLTAKRSTTGKLSGSLLYVQQQGTETYTFRSTSITAIVFKGHTAYVQGVGTLNGVGNHQFVVTVVDNHQQGSADRFGMQVVNGNYAPVDDCTFLPVNLALGQARIVR